MLASMCVFQGILIQEPPKILNIPMVEIAEVNF